ncbi:MAG: GGDEF domain-containing protein [Bradyrhizobium sp.]|jgi:diguanylate cyclase (GGDEF)-like protein|uniref:diguanylate cyclase n=2 Tax=Bradyrhizobium TaxID=374 RepID=A0ABS5G581_9BRAD|nr:MULTISPECIES: GGDEF domain-containing protein [Bradyrhizobium]RTM04810.1 MAG: GGDEF domain-containing protein [Bradyrhizobiaceae bacterium]ABQ35132.1 diguanylate cyclase [Bradyrhizobium sp. BTAi1]MBR1136345.1 GGDEF domain-containing protein [Bradyrhizobium denitrificans]MCL8488799.1 GGDEF domain-containing protein [Bradyrhizobium denitrificans]MDU1492788.1 GGDEF domain-containing protein [Bradyrhizobium sp.]
MGTTAPPLSPSIVADTRGVKPPPSRDVRARRVGQRRQIYAMIAGCYLIDAVILLIYAQAGTVPASIAPVYAAIGLATVALWTLLSESGFNERFRDHYLVVPQSIVSMMFTVAFCYVAPEVSIVFLCTLYLVVGFSSLRATPRQTAICWTFLALGLAGLFLLTDKPLGMPTGGALERLATLLVFVLTIAGCMFLGIFSSSLRESLYQRGLKLKEAYRRIEELAELDELTGALNRRSIMHVLEEELTRSRQTGKPCSVMLIDLDWFKRINDEHGHPTGDDVLRTFAITMFANIRSSDRFGRYGGEEFLLVLPGAPLDPACRLAERLRQIIADLDWSAFSAGLQVTFSAGVATSRGDETTESLLSRADRALYASKAQGRNRVTRA